ncbi:MAG: hypothetical protein DHS20C21_17810 [Gemmatimonadota bacterium]|nr:MAG: hypothetical protein DHS20C21_17810 [Gemmatimonadota bacterium]
MTEKTPQQPEPTQEELAAAAAAELRDTGPQVPNPYERPADVDRKIRGAVDRMLEVVQNPYEVVIVVSQEARRLNERRIRAKSILNQAVEHVDELVPEVPFVPRPVEDEDPEIKPTNEALERMAIGILDYHIDDKVVTAPCYYEGEIDFSLYPDEEEKGDATKGS